MALSENLKKLRERAGMTQAELAEAIGVAQPTLAQYESGLKVPSVITAVRMESVLHTTCAEIVGGDKEKQKENSDCSQQPEQEKKSCVSGITIDLHGNGNQSQLE